MRVWQEALLGIILIEALGDKSVAPGDRPDNDKMQNHPGHSMPSGIGSRIKPQMAPPRSSPSAQRPQGRVDPAAEFLKSRERGVSAADAGASALAQRPTGTAGTTAAKGSKKDAGPVPDEVKPKYKGTYVGQSVNTGGKFVRKPVSYVDKDSGEQKYGGVWGKQDNQLSWDGQDWVRSSEFKGRRST